MFMTGISGIIPGVNATAISSPGGTDPHFASTVLLAGPNAASGANSFPDESFANHGTLTSPGITNDAHVTNSVTLFGAPMMVFDSGLNDNFQLADHADWNPANGLITVEGFVYLSTASTTSNWISQWDSGGNRGWVVQYRGDLGTPTLGVVASSDGTANSTIVGGSLTIPATTLYYWCWERAASNVHRMYAGPMGGTASMIDKQTNSINIFNSTAPLMLSGTFNLSSNLHGLLGEVRITKGVARYDTDSGYPVPTAKFPRS